MPGSEHRGTFLLLLWKVWMKRRRGVQRSVAAMAHNPDAITTKVYFDIKIGEEDAGRWAPHACMEGVSERAACCAVFSGISWHA